MKERQTGVVPVHLRDAHYGGAGKLGHVGYQYAHDFPNHYVEQQYLPDELQGTRFYEPGTLGYEQNIRAYFEQIGRKQ